MELTEPRRILYFKDFQSAREPEIWVRLYLPEDFLSACSVNGRCCRLAGGLLLCQRDTERWEVVEPRDRVACTSYFGDFGQCNSVVEVFGAPAFYPPLNCRRPPRPGCRHLQRS
jgi:hypothetical protein